MRKIIKDSDFVPVQMNNLVLDGKVTAGSYNAPTSDAVAKSVALGEESMMANLPIAANTLRFSFGDLDYDPTEHWEGRDGTWTKKNTKFTNVWDWTNENTNWATAFGGGSTTNPGAFADYENNPVKVIAAGDTSTVTDFSRFFQNCYAITEICPIDTSNATNVFLMFSYCDNCTKFPDMDFSSATETRAVYQHCITMVSGPNIIFPTDHDFNLTNFFWGCEKLETVPLYNLERCTNTTAMFQEANSNSDMSLKMVPEFDTSNVTSMGKMFVNCDIKTVPKFDTSNVTDMNNMFEYCEYLQAIPVLDTSKVSDMHNIFYECKSLSEIPALDYSKVTRFDGFAHKCENLTEIPEMNIEANVTRCDGMFADCSGIKSGQKALYDKLSAIGTITNHTGCFKNCGIDTPEGRAQLEQIPKSWGGLKAEE